jgi:putative molybdopterin biosynthesis protein
MNTLDIAGGERLLTAGEIAKILKISRAKVYRLISKGMIPAILIGRAVRVIPSDLKEYARRSHIVHLPDFPR